MPLPPFFVKVRIMKKLLVTGFDPFGGQTVNPAWEAVSLLPDTVGDFAVTKLLVPTVYGLAAKTALEKAQKIKPDAIVCVGQAGGRAKVTPEVVGINLRDASICDNAGVKPWNEPVVPGGADALFSTLPVHEMVEKAQKKGLPCALSYSAGAFACNDLLYTLLHHYQGTDTQVGFIHVPFLPSQTDEKTPSLPLETIVQTLICLLENI